MNETHRITFAAGTGRLDRAAHLRDAWPDLLRHGSAAILPLWQGKVLIDPGTAGPRLGWVKASLSHRGDAADPPVFLGLTGESPCFAADLSRFDEHAARSGLSDSAGFVDLRAVAGELDADGASIAATAKGLVGWHRTHRFCSRCGAESRAENGGWRRRCPACAGLHFPRTDPVVIMLVLHGDRVLVGRQPGFPERVYSLLAGFMEPGETIEEAVRREVHEETSVRVGRAGYLACQPWPFPSNLMLGCIAEARTTEITIDPTELEDAQWIDRARMQAVLEGRDPHIAAPRRDAIARAILDDWVKGDLPPF